MTDEDLKSLLPPTVPKARLIWTAIVDIAERRDLGIGPQGHRFIVPILGGRFYAGPDVPELKGTVVPGGADRQLLRADGIRELDALYEMQTNDGAILTVNNRVIIDENRAPERYAMSMQSPTGGFVGFALDQTADVEYSFYGVATLALCKLAMS